MSRYLYHPSPWGVGAPLQLRSPRLVLVLKAGPGVWSSTDAAPQRNDPSTSLLAEGSKPVRYVHRPDLETVAHRVQGDNYPEYRKAKKSGGWTWL